MCTSPAGTSRSTCASPSTHPTPTTPGQDRTVRRLRRQDDDACQAKTVCVPLVTLKGDSYRLKDRDLGRVPTAKTEEQ